MDKQGGISLIELIIGMVVFAIAMVIIVSFLAPQAPRSLEPIYQIRATELAKSMLNEITAKAFDEHSDRIGGKTRCSQGAGPACSAPAELGPDAGESRDRFDDVDDYHGLSELADSRDNSLSALYQGYVIQVAVVYDADLDGVADAVIGDKKLIVVNVQTPGGDNIEFASYRSNY